MNDFKGRVAIVTGGSRGIGAAIVEKFRELGATVYSWSRTEGVDCRFGADIGAATVRLLAAHKKIDILVNNAGEFGPVKSLLQYTFGEWANTMSENLTTQFLVCQAVIPHMVKAGYGRVINMSSVVAKDANPMAPAYTVAKSGVVAMTKCLGRELAKTGVTVNCITPAACNTDLFKNTPKEQIDVMLAKTPVNRFIALDEIVSAVCWLASEGASGTTASVVDVSGGRSQF